MKNYNNAKIYKIFGNDKVYIGSTTQPYLSMRLAQHKYALAKHENGQHNYCTSFEVVSDPNCYIELVEMFSANNCDEVRAKEGHYIRTNECCNKYIAGRDLKTYYLDNLEKYKQNYQDKKEQKKQYYLDNRDKRLTYQKDRYRRLKQEISI